MIHHPTKRSASHRLPIQTLANPRYPSALQPSVADPTYTDHDANPNPNMATQTSSRAPSRPMAPLTAYGRGAAPHRTCTERYGFHFAGMTDVSAWRLDARNAMRMELHGAVVHCNPTLAASRGVINGGVTACGKLRGHVRRARRKYA
ncbi:hypothetical protein PSPO01_04880 [Paraphaeosphaeria sporulosa]